MSVTSVYFFVVSILLAIMALSLVVMIQFGESKISDCAHKVLLVAFILVIVSVPVVIGILLFA